MSWRSASTCTSRPSSRAVALVTGPIETTRAPSGTPPPGLDEEAHRGAGGERHVVGARERRRAARRRAARRRCRRGPPRRPRRRARAAPSGSTSRASAARATSTRLSLHRAPRSSASTSASATERSRHHVGADPAARQLARRCPGRSPRRVTPASARASPPRPARRSSSAHAVGAREADERVVADRAPRELAVTGRGSIRIAGVSTTSAPSARSRAASPLACARARVTATTCAVQRPPLEPGERLAQARRPGPTTRDRRRPDARPRPRARRCRPACPSPCAGPGSVPRSTTAAGSSAVAPAADQPLGDLRQAA